MPEDAIVIDHVSKVFKMYNTPTDRLKEVFSPSRKVRHTDFYALKNIDMSVKKGEILGIMGRNGAGKSTLLKVITGILEPSSGSVKIDGRVSSLLELGTGFNVEYTGIENIYFYGTLMGFSKAEMDAKLEDIIEFAEIGDYIDQVVKTYSSGMFARLAFSCAIHIDPEILIVDEILSVGDMRFQAKCFQKFKEFKNRGVTILYVGHDVGMMRTFCDRCIWLNSGEIVAEGEPTFITAQYTEFMYSDDISDFTTYKKYVEEKTRKEQEKKQLTEQTVPVQSEEPDETQEENRRDHQQSIVISPIVAPDSAFPDCIAHWGSQVGMIQSVRIMNASGEEKNHFSPYEKICIEVIYQEIPDLDPEMFSVAVSIKNKEGTDLCVKTTFDEKIIIEKGTAHCVRFSFRTMLASGDYYLVVALENRANINPTYYEYIEGVKYFKLFDDKKIFGVFDVPAEIWIDGEVKLKGDSFHVC